MRKREDIVDDCINGNNRELTLLEVLLDIREILQTMHLDKLAVRAGLK